MSTRKKWATSFPRVDAWKRTKESRAAAYRYVTEQQRFWRAEMLRSQHLTVWVDAGDGWQVHERIDLDTWTGDVTDHLAEQAASQRVADRHNDTEENDR